MKGRCKPENKDRAAYREESPKHVVEFELLADEDTKRHLFQLDNNLRKAGNDVAGPMSRQIGQMKRTKAYRKLQKDYNWHKTHMQGLSEEDQKYKDLDTEKSAITAKMNAMQKEYGITSEDVRKAMIRMQEPYSLPSVLARTRGEDIWKGIESVLYADGKNIHCRRRGDLPIMRAKEIGRIILLKADKNNRLYVTMQGYPKMYLMVPEKDYFLQDEYDAILDYLTNNGDEQERQAVEVMKKQGTIVPVFRPCYGAICCETIRGKLRCFVQITIAARALPKYDRYGEHRHVRGVGRVGCDIGTQSVAAVAKDSVDLENLGERNEGSLKKTRQRIGFLQQKMDASRRATNPDRYNEDGTYNKKSSGQWEKSNAYRKMQAEMTELYRKDALTRLYANRELANHLRSEGDVLITEPSNTRALAKREKKTKRSDKTKAVVNKKGEKKVIHPYERKKRFGKSVGKRSPAAFQAELKKKFGDGYHEVPIATYRASQYDFMLDDYIKKKLSARWHILPDGRKVQRDIMSAFLMYCADDEIQHIDRNRCFETFEEFWNMHQELIDKIMQEHLHICNSGIEAA